MVYDAFLINVVLMSPSLNTGAMDNFDVLTVQAMPPDTPQEVTQPDVAVESPLFWFLGWFNRNSDSDDDDSSDGEESSVSTTSSPTQPETLVSCLICMDDHAEPDTLPIASCGHAYCRDCLSIYVSGKLKESRYPIHCPTCVTENRPDVREYASIFLDCGYVIGHIDVTEDIFELLDMSEEDVDRLIEAQLRAHAISLSCIR